MKSMISCSEIVKSKYWWKTDLISLRPTLPFSLKGSPSYISLYLLSNILYISSHSVCLPPLNLFCLSKIHIPIPFLGDNTEDVIQRKIILTDLDVKDAELFVHFLAGETVEAEVSQNALHLMSIDSSWWVRIVLMENVLDFEGLENYSGTNLTNNIVRKLAIGCLSDWLLLIELLWLSAWHSNKAFNNIKIRAI